MKIYNITEDMQKIVDANEKLGKDFSVKQEASKSLASR
jgi:hypothetical protein